MTPPEGVARARCRPMPLPEAVLVCPPDHFDVVDVKNTFMEGQAGRVDRAAARRQWDTLVALFRGIGLQVETIEPTAGCEDMVFCANQAFPGLDAEGRRVCVASRMKHASRQREVPAFAAWFKERWYRVVEAEGGIFEGGGDAVWHPGRGLIWGGFGGRSEAGVYPHLARVFDVPVIPLELKPPFYHLDTCFCALDEDTVLLHPPAFTANGLRDIRSVFPHVIEADPDDAIRHLACNAAAFRGKHVVLHRGATRTVAKLRAAGYRVVEVDLGEFLKSGGGAYCMKMALC